MNKERLDQALGSIWGLVYRATQQPLDAGQLERLRSSVNTLSAVWDESDIYRGRVSYLCDSVLTSGILSLPARDPSGTVLIMEDCQFLQRYLEKLA